LVDVAGRGDRAGSRDTQRQGYPRAGWCLRIDAALSRGPPRGARGHGGGRRFPRLIAAALALGQTNVGRISGTVSDSSGAAIVNCAVEATDAARLKQSTRTDSSGFYVFPSLPFGVYDLSVEQPGFRASRQTGLVLDAASQRTVAFRLEVGQVTESVEVNAAAEQVQATSGNVGRVINGEQVSNIALNGREYTQLLRLSPGVVATTLNVFNPQLALNQQNINGIRTQSSYFLVDGAENHDNGANSNGIVDPNIDAIAEVKMETSSYAAEFGGRAGAIARPPDSRSAALQSGS